MSSVLARWNLLPVRAAMDEILPCCGSRAWAEGVVARRPLGDETVLLRASDDVWRGLSEPDWSEAFRSHPRIGETQAPKQAERQSAEWSAQEQRSVTDAGDAARIALVEGNRVYEHRFNRIFIVCATGKSLAEILNILHRRLENDGATELRESAEQQRQITQIRLRKWLQK